MEFSEYLQWDRVCRYDPVFLRHPVVILVCIMQSNLLNVVLLFVFLSCAVISVAHESRPFRPPRVLFNLSFPCTCTATVLSKQMMTSKMYTGCFLDNTWTVFAFHFLILFTCIIILNGIIYSLYHLFIHNKIKGTKCLWAYVPKSNCSHSITVNMSEKLANKATKFHVLVLMLRHYSLNVIQA